MGCGLGLFFLWHSPVPPLEIVYPMVWKHAACCLFLQGLTSKSYLESQRRLGTLTDESQRMLEIHRIHFALRYRYKPLGTSCGML